MEPFPWSELLTGVITVAMAILIRWLEKRKMKRS